MKKEAMGQWEAVTVRMGASFGFSSPCSPGSILKALCADGKTRRALVTSHADTYFTLPARVKVHGKTVTGFVYWHGGAYASPVLRFTPRADRANWSELPAWEGDRK